MKKKTIAVLFGGNSSEHEVSCLSVQTIILNLDQERYDLLLLGITKSGEWKKVDSIAEVVDGSWMNSQTEAILFPKQDEKNLLLLSQNTVEKVHVDVVFPVLHGFNGEDGTVQGLLALYQIPYVGCGILSSAVCMDKFFTKIIVERLGIRQAKFVPVFKRQLKDMDRIIQKIEETLYYPLFIKPSNAGSSRGVSKVKTREELIAALILASKHDKKILVEETIIGRELECAVLSENEPKASRVGEILAAAEFYNYEAKYHSPESKTVLHPELPEGIEEKIRDASIRIFRAVDGYGLARVDFFLETETNEIVFNEINTLPGFTSISMYPMLWKEQGVLTKELVSKLIESAYLREEHYVI